MRAQQLARGRGHTNQDAVPRRMPVLVVDRLELIEVKTDERQRSADGARSFFFALAGPR